VRQSFQKAFTETCCAEPPRWNSRRPVSTGRISHEIVVHYLHSARTWCLPLPGGPCLDLSQKRTKRYMKRRSASHDGLDGADVLVSHDADEHNDQRRDFSRTAHVYIVVTTPLLIFTLACAGYTAMGLLTDADAPGSSGRSSEATFSWYTSPVQLHLGGALRS
jgi:hypothetical protein